MIYLFASIFLLSINNILWATFAPKVASVTLIRNRAIFTVIFTVIIFWISLKIFQFSLESIPFVNLFLIGVIGFIGLFFLVLGFQRGTLLQYLIYSLLLVVVITILTNKENNIRFQEIIVLVSVFLGYLYFIYHQFGTPRNIKNLVIPHVYFAIAHVFFGLLLFLQWEYLKHAPQVAIAFSQELVVLILSTLILFVIPKSKKTRLLPWWQYALLALPISLAVILGLEGLKSTNPFHASLIGLLTPVVTLIFGLILGLEKTNQKALLGLLIMILGLTYFYLN